MIDLDADLRYWEERLSKSKTIDKPKEETDSKLHIKNINEYLFIKEDRDIIIEYICDDGEVGKVIINLIEMSLYDIFKYLLMKNSKTIDEILISFIGQSYMDLMDILSDEYKLELIKNLEELSCIDEMFKVASPDQSKVEESSPQGMGDCIKAFGGTVIYLCETWGKLPEEIMKGLTYRQFKWYLDIIIDRQNEIDRKVNGDKRISSITANGSSKASDNFSDTSKLINDGYSMIEDSEGCVRFRKSETR